jgi:ABC-type nitrate/sulfonate/bicarbonate transport system substrate-binding protein
MKRAVAKTLVSLLLSVLVFATKTDLLAAPGEVIITHASMSTTAIPLWVAQRQNFFGKYGVKSKSVWVRSNPTPDRHVSFGGHANSLRWRNDGPRRCRGRQGAKDLGQSQ